MTTFSKTGFKSLNYNSFRPHYPASFYKILENYAIKDGVLTSPLNKSIDLGCGSGVATYPLLNFSKKVVGIDLSELMIDTANSLKVKRLQELGIKDDSVINFEQGSAESFLENIESKGELRESFDLLTAAQCIHWFQDHELFFKNASQLLKKGGVLSYFYYLDPIITKFSDKRPNQSSEFVINRAIEIYNKYVYDDDRYMGKSWEQPGRNILKSELESVDQVIPHDLYNDIKIKKFQAKSKINNGIVEYDDDDLKLVKVDSTLQDLADYFGTYSAYHNFKQSTGDKVNLIESYISELELEFGWDRKTTKVDITWNAGYTFMRKS